MKLCTLYVFGYFVLYIHFIYTFEKKNRCSLSGISWWPRIGNAEWCDCRHRDFDSFINIAQPMEKSKQRQNILYYQSCNLRIICESHLNRRTFSMKLHQQQQKYYVYAVHIRGFTNSLRFIYVLLFLGWSFFFCHSGEKDFVEKSSTNCVWPKQFAMVILLSWTAYTGMYTKKN